MTPAPSAPPLRVYTFYLDGILKTHPFSIGDWGPAELDPELNRQFHEWLEMTAPGAFDCGRITRIRFADLNGGVVPPAELLPGAGPDGASVGSN